MLHLLFTCALKQTKDVNNDELSGMPTTSGDADISDKIPAVGNSRQWTSLPSKGPVCCFSSC